MYLFTTEGPSVSQGMNLTITFLYLWYIINQVIRSKVYANISSTKDFLVANPLRSMPSATKVKTTNKSRVKKGGPQGPKRNLLNFFYKNFLELSIILLKLEYQLFIELIPFFFIQLSNIIEQAPIYIIEQAPMYIINYSHIFYILILLLSYIFIQSYYIYRVLEKDTCPFSVRCSLAFLHCRLLFMTGLYIYLLTKLIALTPDNLLTDLYNSIISIVPADKAKVIYDYKTYFLDLVNLDVCKYIIIPLIFISLILSLAFFLKNKTNMKFWIKIVFLVVSSLILRALLLEVLNILPWDMSIGVDILTAKFLFANLFREFSSLFKEIFYWLIPVSYLDTTYDEWRAHIDRRLSIERTERGKHSVSSALDQIIPDEHKRMDIWESLRGQENIQSILYLRDRSFYKGLYVFVRENANNFYPIKISELHPNFFNDKPGELAPFVFSKNFTITAYAMKGAYPDVEELCDKMWGVSGNGIGAKVEFTDERTTENAYQVYFESIDIELGLVKDWNAQDILFLKTGPNEWTKYNPNNITRDMVGLTIFVKIPDGTFIRTNVEVEILTRLDEVSFENSRVGNFWNLTFQSLILERRPPQTIWEHLSVSYAKVKSPIFSQIQWENLDWKKANEPEWK